MALQKLSKQTENKIVDALRDVVKLVDDGLTPNDAIVKVAGDKNVSDGHVQLMVYAYNTGRQTDIRNTGQSREEKSASCDLADYNTIIKQLYPNYKKADDVHEDYFKSPPKLIVDHAKQARIEKLRKQAAEEKAKSDLYRQTQPYDDTASVLRDLKSSCRHAHQKLSKAQDHLADCISDLDYVFRSKPYNFKDVFETATMVYGKKAEALKDSLLEANPGLSKSAARELLPTSHSIFGLIKDCLDSHDEYEKAKVDFDNILKQACIDRDKLVERYKDKLPEVTSDYLEVNGLEKTSQFIPEIFRLPFEKKADAPRAAGYGALMKQIAPYIDFRDKPQTSFPPILDPAHQSELRNVQLEASLSDLLANDQIIQGHGKPDEVLDMYNELNQVAPNAMGNKAIARAYLRKWLGQGQLADFDLKMLAEMEKTINDSSKPMATNPLLSERPK